VAAEGGGVAEVLAAIEQHRKYLADHGLLSRRRQARRRREILELVEERLLARVGTDRIDALAARVAAGELDPYTAADELVRRTGVAEADQRGSGRP
jgi:LAO/AO transport system kinase